MRGIKHLLALSSAAIMASCGQKDASSEQVSAELYSESQNEAFSEYVEPNSININAAGVENASMAIGATHNYVSSPPDNDVVAAPTPPTKPKPKPNPKPERNAN